MKRTPARKFVMVMCLCLCPSAFVVGQQDSGRQSRRSISDLQTKTVEELRKEQARLARVLSESESLESRPGSRALTVDDLTKARLLGEIVRMRYLERIVGIRETPASKREAQPGKSELSSDPIKLTVVQRRSKPVPGFRAGINLKIGDITHEQALLEIVSLDFRKPIVDTMSVQQGDVIPFTLGGVQYYLSVVELRNLLVGDDFGVFEISTKRPEQTAEIERLLETIGSCGLVFLRNGKEATAAETVAHLRRKWRKTKPRITTVQGFINRVASRSSVSGTPYQVKLADGSTMATKAWLRERLEQPDRKSEP